jgi:DNA-binding MarR family transcriptional regulator
MVEDIDFDLDAIRGAAREQFTKEGFAGAQAEFMLTLARAYNQDIDDYSLIESMDRLEQDAGNPDISGLINADYITRIESPFRRKYYDITEKGWNTLKQINPDLGKPTGEHEGDLGESGAHRIAIALTEAYLARFDDIETVTRYPVIDERELDIIGVGADGTPEIVGEVWLNSNDRASAVADYTDLAVQDARALWVVEGVSDVIPVVNALVDRIDDDRFQLDTKVKYRGTGPDDATPVYSMDDLVETINDAHDGYAPGMTRIKTIRSIEDGL